MKKTAVKPFQRAALALFAVTLVLQSTHLTAYAKKKSSANALPAGSSPKLTQAEIEAAAASDQAAGAVSSQGSWVWMDLDGDGNAACYFVLKNGDCLKNAYTPDGFPVNALGQRTRAGIPIMKQLGTQPNKPEEALNGAPRVDLGSIDLNAPTPAAALQTDMPAVPAASEPVVLKRITTS